MTAGQDEAYQLLKYTLRYASESVSVIAIYQGLIVNEPLKMIAGGKTSLLKQPLLV